MTPTFAVAPWSEYLPLLALFGATAAYISAIRLWFHKLRTDALDALLKADRTPDEKYKPEHLKERVSRSVAWLQGLALIDITVVIGAGMVFRLAFYDELPRRNWSRGGDFDSFICAIQIMWLAFVFLSVAHVVSALRAFGLRSEYVSSKVHPVTIHWKSRPETWIFALVIAAAAVAIFLCV